MRRALIFTLLLAVGGCGTPTRKVAPRRQVTSPMGGYIVTAETPREPFAPRSLAISRPGDPSPIIQFPFARTVDLSWAPDESAVAVFDALSEVENHILIWAIPSGRPLLEIRREDTCAINPNLPCGQLYRRVHFSNIVWLPPDRVQVTVEMYQPLEPGLPPEIHALAIVNVVE